MTLENRIRLQSFKIQFSFSQSLIIQHYIIYFYPNLKNIQMIITITDTNNLFNLQVEPDQSIEDIKALIEAQTGVPLNRIQLFSDGAPLKDTDTLASRGLGANALLYLTISPEPINKPKKGLGIASMIKKIDKQIKSVGEAGYQFNHRRVQQFKSEARRLINEMKNDPFRVSQIAQQHPDVADAINKGDVERLASIMHRKNQEKIKELKQKQRKFIQLSRDPMNPEYQRLLEERINQQNIDKNLQFANEYIPQVFGHITMLYIKASINKVPIQAFVDSGAQSTIMSQSLAERCGLMRLVDKRQAGTAVGVGSCKILGKIHAAQIEIQGKFLTCSFTVIQNNSTEFLLGLDMLRRFNCVIDLSKNSLIFQGGVISTNFLSEGQIQKSKNPFKKQQLEVKLKKLADMGFSRAESIQALKNSGFDEEIAGNMLMQRKYGNK